MIKRKPVKSHTILTMGYDKLTKTLEVEFRNKAVYDYYDVPTFIYERALTKNSINTYLNKTVYNHYKQKRLR